MSDWTNEQPTGPGFYWLEASGGVIAVRVREQGGELWVIGDGLKLPLAQAGGYYWWAERLVPPARRAGTY